MSANPATSSTRTRTQKSVNKKPSPRPPDDHYPTPPEVVRALLAHESFEGPIWEPCAGSGEMARELRAAGHTVIATTLLEGSNGVEGWRDFLKQSFPAARTIVTNPPFRLAQEVVEHALTMKPRKAAFLLPVNFLAGQRRHKSFHPRFSPSRVLMFANRIAFYPASWTGDRPNPKHHFAWFVYDEDAPGAWPEVPLRMILSPPCPHGDTQ